MSPKSADQFGTAGRGRSELFAIGAGALSIFLAWQIVQTNLTPRLPPEVALRLAPGSSGVLQRASEASLAAGRFEEARELADASLQQTPFNARALRVSGLARAEAGQAEQANLILTLAGNWSLRDDPTHAWLIQQRLRQGDYVSAFGHADTLVRRRSDIHSRTFELFTAAAQSDPRAFPPLVDMLGRQPPWRSAYMEHLRSRTDSAELLLKLALALAKSDAPMSQPELQAIYQKWISEGRLAAVRYLRRQLAGAKAARIQNGDFADETGREIDPFGWDFGTSAGVSSAIDKDPVNARNSALRIAHDGFSSGAPTSQLLILDPGAAVLTARTYREVGEGPTSIVLSITCVESGQRILERRAPEHSGETTGWLRFEMALIVPQDGCMAQWLRLTPTSAESTSESVVWFDDMAIRR